MHAMYFIGRKRHAPRVLRYSKHNLSICFLFRAIPVQTMALPAKKEKREKWSQQEDKQLMDLRAGGMSWGDISKRLPGRSAISCRLHYQNYLRLTEWNEDHKNKLARLYERYVKNVVADLEV
jgi:Myb-like DNA-binding domain